MIITLDNSFCNEVIIIIKEAVAEMKNQGIEQWDEIYPSFEVIKDDIESKVAYGYFHEGELSAYMVLNEEYSSEYNLIDWSIGGKNLIIHRLTVKPSKQRMGIAKKCMLFAEQYAEEKGYNSIRLDAFLYNPAARKVYETLNYRKAGIINLRKGKFYCYEKEIRRR